MTCSVLCAIGTRPEAIKMAPVVEALARQPERARLVVCSTGQHRELLDPILELFGIRPDFDLGALEAGQSLAALTGRMFEAFDRVVEEVRPDWILAQGDTTTVLVASMCAFYRHIAFGHVEAGLRTGDLSRPFPEELNRRVADELATLLFAPTEHNRRTLLDLGASPERILVTGNTGIDALHRAAAMPFEWGESPLAALPLDRRLVLVTAHRRESFGGPFEQMCLALRELATRFADEDVHLVYPVHLNPEVRRPVEEILSGCPNLTRIEPLDYLSLVNLMRRSTLVLTDSGGIQEEAPSFGVPVLVMRERSERPEGIEAGVARLVGTSREAIVESAAQLLSDPDARAKMARATSPYGDGKAAPRIAAALLDRSPAG